MNAPLIAHDILIEAPVETVWRAVTEPEQIKKWFTDEAELDLRAGGEGKFVWVDKATTKPTTARLSVTTVEPPHTFAFRWGHADGDAPKPGNSILVEFNLEAEGNKTRLRVVETGLAEMPWSDDEKAAYAKDHENGWNRHLGDLQDYAAS